LDATTTMDGMRVCVPITTAGTVEPRWGRADRVAVADVEDGAVSDWTEFDVGWGALHDSAPEGAHHARIARFLRDHQVQAIAVSHVGAGMQRMLTTMGIRIQTGHSGDARAAITRLT
jgi:predicted Fe-Mo cluster-binding NifX family protein